MFRNTFQSNFLSLFSTSGSDCLELWGVRCDASFVEDADLHSNVLELRKNREAVQDIKDSFIVCPASIDKKLGITLPCFCLIVKNANEFFTFEVNILDDTDTERSLTVSNYQLNTRVRPKICTIPLSMEDGWNIVQIDIADFVKRAYKTTYVETQRVRIHPACRLRRVYFSDKIYNIEDLPKEFQLSTPTTSSSKLK